MATKKATDVENLETDLVVIGAGGSGLAAAVAAAEEGSKVIVLEKRSKAGGNTAMAVGLFACESPVQKRLRIDVSKDECFKIAIACGAANTLIPGPGIFHSEDVKKIIKKVNLINCN